MKLCPSLATERERRPGSQTRATGQGSESLTPPVAGHCAGHRDARRAGRRERERERERGEREGGEGEGEEGERERGESGGEGVVVTLL